MPFSKLEGIIKLNGKEGDNMTLKSKTLVEQQKELEYILEKLGYAPTDEYENDTGTIIFTKYEKFGIGVRIERNQ